MGETCAAGSLRATRKNRPPQLMQTLCQRLGFGRAQPENIRTDAYQGGPFGHGRLKIAAHSHRQDRQGQTGAGAQAVPQFTQEGKMGPCGIAGIKDRRQAHEALDIKMRAALKYIIGQSG